MQCTGPVLWVNKVTISEDVPMPKVSVTAAENMENDAQGDDDNYVPKWKANEQSKMHVHSELWITQKKKTNCLNCTKCTQNKE